MVNDKMACGIHFDKKKQTDLLMARIGEEAHNANIDKEGCHPMDFTGRPMRGYVFVTPDAFDTDEEFLENGSKLKFIVENRLDTISDYSKTLLSEVLTSKPEDRISIDELKNTLTDA